MSIQYHFLTRVYLTYPLVTFGHHFTSLLILE